MATAGHGGLVSPTPLRQPPLSLAMQRRWEVGSARLFYYGNRSWSVRRAIVDGPLFATALQQIEANRKRPSTVQPTLVWKTNQYKHRVDTYSSASTAAVFTLLIAIRHTVSHVAHHSDRCRIRQLKRHAQTHKHTQANMFAEQTKLVGDQERRTSHQASQHSQPDQ